MNIQNALNIIVVAVSTFITPGIYPLETFSAALLVCKW